MGVPEKKPCLFFRVRARTFSGWKNLSEKFWLGLRREAPLEKRWLCGKSLKDLLDLMRIVMYGDEHEFDYESAGGQVVKDI